MYGCENTRYPSDDKWDDIVNKILRAGNAHEKEYVVRVDKPVTDYFIAKMSAGVPILDTITLPCKVSITSAGKPTSRNERPNQRSIRSERSAPKGRNSGNVTRRTKESDKEKSDSSSIKVWRPRRK